MKYIKKTLLFLLSLVVVTVLYVAISIAHGTANDYQPEEKIVLEIEGTAIDTIDSDTLSFLLWNVGYGGLGAEANFFYDAGKMLTSGDKMVKSPKKDVEKNINGVSDFLTQQPVDFYLLQEVDRKSSRSYYINQYEKYGALHPNYTATFAPNYKVKRVPLPLAEPFNVIGKVYSGLATYSRFQPTSATRYQLPGGYEWPSKVFHLDRCLAAHRFPLKNGKELIVINTHNSAFDKGGVLKKQEMAYLKSLVEQEYNAGNYIVVGGDWNQCPPDFAANTFRPNMTPDSYYQVNVPTDFLPNDWTWAYDKKTPTNRKLVDSYQGEDTFVTLIDFYLTSPNVEVLNVEGFGLNFEYSDHQPMGLKVRLK